MGPTPPNPTPLPRPVGAANRCRGGSRLSVAPTGGSASKPPPPPPLPPSPLPPLPPSFNPAALPPFLRNPLSSFPVLGPARLPRRRAQAFTINYICRNIFRRLKQLGKSTLLARPASQPARTLGPAPPLLSSVPAESPAEGCQQQKRASSASFPPTSQATNHSIKRNRAFPGSFPFPSGVPR